jgi:hypothetical protein
MRTNSEYHNRRPIPFPRPIALCCEFARQGISTGCGNLSPQNRPPYKYVNDQKGVSLITWFWRISAACLTRCGTDAFEKQRLAGSCGGGLIVQHEAIFSRLGRGLREQSPMIRIARHPRERFERPGHSVGNVLTVSLAAAGHLDACLGVGGKSLPENDR